MFYPAVLKSGRDINKTRLRNALLFQDIDETKVNQEPSWRKYKHQCEENSCGLKGYQWAFKSFTISMYKEHNQPKHI